MRRVAFLLVMASIAAAVVLLVVNVPGGDLGAGSPNASGDGPAAEGDGGSRRLTFLDGMAPASADDSVARSAAAGGGVPGEVLTGQAVGGPLDSGGATGTGGANATSEDTGTAGQGGNGGRQSAAVLPAGQGGADSDSSLHALRPLIPRQPRKLTSGGCCTAAWWSEDSSQLRFVDRGPDDFMSMIYGVDVWPPGSNPAVVDEELMVRTGAPRLVVRYSGTNSEIEDLSSGDRWPLPTGGNPVRISPDGSRVVWWEVHDGWKHNGTLVKVFGSDVYGFDERELGDLWGARVVSFLPDNRRVLVLGRPVRNDTLFVLETMDVETGERTEVARGSWLMEPALSPDGQWAVYMTAMDREHPDSNGIWVAPTNGGEPRKLDFTGSYRWRDGSRLVYVPMQLGSRSHEVWQTDVATGETVRLLGAAEFPFRIANNDWSISPDGATMAFLSAADRNLWVVDLP